MVAANPQLRSSGKGPGFSTPLMQTSASGSEAQILLTCQSATLNPFNYLNIETFNLKVDDTVGPHSGHRLS